MTQWHVIFRELRDALSEAKKKHKHLKDSSTIRLRILLTNKEVMHYKVPLAEVERKIWDLAESHKNIIYICLETSRGLSVYSTTRYNIIQGEGARGETLTITQFARMPDDRRDLVVRLLHAQIQDRFVKEANNDS
jgi:hypothetical protein